MSANPIRRRTARAVVAATLCLVLLGGCTHSQKPAKNYAGAEDNFLEGCESRAKDDNKKADDQGQEDTAKIAAPADYCQCVFDAIEKAIPYSEFKKTQSTMQDEGGALPDKIVKAYEDCDPAETASS
ncbi:MAG: hypothetical protein JWO77_3601 [Ilumatobacteraceae bacterium]|nr:hypothetical protein [Ilumatobacteraceae bacterium]